MSKQTETRRQVAERIVDEHLDEAMSPREYAATASALIDAIEAALKAEREQSLTEAARQECVFCAGIEGYNSTPDEAALPVETDAGNYVHRNDPPHGLAGVYCKAPRIRALITVRKGFEVKTND